MLKHYPTDGLTKEEQAIVTIGTMRIYQKLPTDKHRLIVALRCELGYPEADIASIWGMSQPAVTDYLNYIRKVLTPYKDELKTP